MPAPGGKFAGSSSSSRGYAGGSKYGSPQTGAAGTVSGGSVRSTTGGGGYGGYGGATSTGRAGAGYSGSSARSSPEGGGGRGSPAGGYGGGRPGGGGMGFQGSGKMGALSGQHIAGVSRPGSYAGPKGAFSLENQALAAPFGPYGNYSQITDPAGHLMQRMQARGWSPNTTRGMIGNFNVESRLNPLAAGDLNNPKGLAAGLGQHRLDRLAALQAETRPFEGLNRKTKTFTSGPSLDQQADFIDREMQGLSTNTNRGARKVGRTFQANPNMSVADATSTFARGYERPSKAALRSSMPQRLAGTGFDFGESTAPGLTQIAGRESTITPAGYTTAMPRAKPDLRGLTMGMPRDKPSLPAAFSGGPVLAGVPRAKPSSPALRSTMAQAFSTARPMRLGGGLSSLGTRGRQRTIL